MRWMVLAVALLGGVSLSDRAHAEDPPRVWGVYDSNWGPVELYQYGDRIEGTYDCCGGGTIEGTIEGDVIEYEWNQPGLSGRGWWRVAPDANALDGRWGHQQSADNGGDWNLFRRVPVS